MLENTNKSSAPPRASFLAVAQAGALKNPEAEKCAQDIAAVFNDPIARQTIYSAFLEAHPQLNQWKAIALADRARSLAQNMVDNPI